MFATKPPTPSREFDELSRAFDRGTLAALFARDPDTKDYQDVTLSYTFYPVTTPDPKPVQGLGGTARAGL